MTTVEDLLSKFTTTSVELYLALGGPVYFRVLSEPVSRLAFTQGSENLFASSSSSSHPTLRTTNQSHR